MSMALEPPEHPADRSADHLAAIREIRALKAEKRTLLSLLRRSADFTDWSTRQPSYRDAEELHGACRRLLAALEAE